MRRHDHRFHPSSLGALLEDRLLLHGGSLPAATHPLDHGPHARPELPTAVFVNELHGNFSSFNVLVTAYVNVLFNFSGSFPNPGASGATSSNPDGTLLLTSNYAQSIASVTSVLDQAVLANVTAAPVRPGTAAAISARIDCSSPGSLVSQLTAIPVNTLAAQGPSSSSARAQAMIPIAQAISSAQADVVSMLIEGARREAPPRASSR